MTSEDNNTGRDRAHLDAVHFDLGFGAEQMADILWRCDSLRAGKLYHRSLFASQEEAEDFATRLQNAEPDQMFTVEAIKASSVWN
jgi:hypothetical protein